MTARKSKNKRNGKSKKQPKVGRMAMREHANKYADKSKHAHNAYGVQLTNQQTKRN